jgi:hypothetical protein
MDEMKENVIELKEEEDNKNDDEEDEEDEKEMKPKLILFNDNEDEMTFKIKKYKPKKITPRHLLIFDDISDEMRNNRYLRALMKKNRHLRSKVIISTQHFTDVNPDVRKMFDIWILFKDHEEDILKQIYQACSLNISYSKFIELYKDATKEKFNFLFIDKNNCQYRNNFNLEYNT